LALLTDLLELALVQVLARFALEPLAVQVLARFVLESLAVLVLAQPVQKPPAVSELEQFAQEQRVLQVAPAGLEFLVELLLEEPQGHLALQ
jgi:hypothetical protein